MQKYAKITTLTRSSSLKIGPLLGLFLLLWAGMTGCAANEGIFAGGSWQAGSLQDQHLHVLTVDPHHIRTIYAGDARSGVLRSTDAGVHWRSSSAGLPVPIAISSLSFDIPGKVLYAATAAGLFASVDYAAHWHAIDGLPADSSTALAFDVNNVQAIYVGTAHSGVWKSLDSGATWTNISVGLPTPVAKITCLLYDANLKHLWIGFPDLLYRSTDDGASWQVRSNGLPTGAGVNVLAAGAVTSASASLLYLGTDHGFFRSTDDGQHWTPSQASLAALHIRAILLDALQPGIVYVSTDIGVLRSNDDGQNWSQIASGLPADKQPVEGLAQGGDNYSQLLVASHGIYRYPGTGSPLDLSRLLPIALILLFFVLLYRFTLLRRRRIGQASVQGDEASLERGN